jgi:hypothetical protein
MNDLQDLFELLCFPVLGKTVFLYFILIGKFQIIMVRFGEYHNIRFFILNLQIMWVVIV